MAGPQVAAIISATGVEVLQDILSPLPWRKKRRARSSPQQRPRCFVRARCVLSFCETSLKRHRGTPYMPVWPGNTSWSAEVYASNLSKSSLDVAMSNKRKLLSRSSTMIASWPSRPTSPH